MKPIIRLIVVVAVTLLMCEVFFVFARKQLSKYEICNQEKLTDLFLKKTKYDLLFLGSSKTHADINPRIIDSICHLSSFNAGIVGAHAQEFEMVFNAYLEAHPSPKYVVLSFDLHSFVPTKTFYNYTQYFPYIQNKILDSTLNKNGYKTLKLKLLPFIEMFDYTDEERGDIIKGLVGKKEVVDSLLHYKGFVANPNKAFLPFKETNVNPFVTVFSDSEYQCFLRILKTCYTKNIQVIICYSPEYRCMIEKNTINANQIFARIKNDAVSYKMPFLRDDSLAICQDSTLFFDLGHLNEKGSTIYSALFAKEIYPMWK
jgi:hypothetical protein